MEGPGSTGQTVYRVQFDSLAGHEGVDWSELFYWIGDRYYQIGSRVSGYRAEWQINPIDYSLSAGAYPLTLIVMGKNGIKADMIPAGWYLTVPSVVIPPERGKANLVNYDPGSSVPWHSNDSYLATNGWHGPYGPDNFNVDLNIFVEGTQHHSSTEHCPVVWGYRGGAGYKVMGGWSAGYWLHLFGNIADLPTGLHSLGAEMRWDARVSGPIKAQNAWLWVDSDHPIFDKIIEGPQSGSQISLAQTDELTIRTTMQDPGGSGTTEYWLALVGNGQERGFKERIYGYTGINHCTLTGLPPGRYSLFVTYSKDRVGNCQTRSIPTDVWFDIGS